MDNYNERIRKYKLQKFIGMIIKGIGLVFLITSIIPIFSTGKIQMIPIILGLILFFVGNVLNKVGKNNEEKLLK